MDASEESHHTRLSESPPDAVSEPPPDAVSEPPPDAVVSTKWDGITHGVGGRCINICTLCERYDANAEIKGHLLIGVVFVCQTCLFGFKAQIDAICGPKLTSLMTMGCEIIVPRSKGPPSQWYVSSKLPILHKGIWCLHVQSKKSLRDEDCLQKVVTIAQLNELN